MPRALVWSWFVLFFLCGCLPAGRVLAQERFVQDPKELQPLGDRCRRFLEAVGRGEAQAGFDALLINGPLARSDEKVRQKVADLVTKTTEISQRYGRSRGFEQVQSRLVGQNLAIFKYLHEFEQYAVVWYVTFYRAGDPTRDPTWVVVSVRFDTNLEGLLNPGD